MGEVAHFSVADLVQFYTAANNYQAKRDFRITSMSNTQTITVL